MRRALAPDREGRWPDVTAYVAALERRARRPGPRGDARPVAAARPGADPARARPDRAACRGSAARAGRAAAEPAARRGRRRGRAGGAGGRRWPPATCRVRPRGRRRHRLRRVRHARGDRARGLGRCGRRRRLDAAERRRPTYAALSVGTAADWSRARVPAEGVFVGICPGTEIPTHVPQHPECAASEEPVSESATGAPSVDRGLHRLPRGGRHRGAGRAGRRQPAAVGAGAQRGPGDRQPGAATGS